MKPRMKIISWNVNGIRACVRKDTFFDYLYAENPDLLFVQETKAHIDQLHPEITEPSGYITEWSSAEKKGYSGVSVYIKQSEKLKPIQIIKDIGIPEYDSEGRVIGVEFNDKVIFGVYFPNSQRPGRLDYKLNFKQAFFDYCNEFIRGGKQVIITGDFNAAHTEIDLARPKENKNSAGFLPEERAWMDRIRDQYHYTDTFRHFNPDVTDAYTWWTYRAGARPRNIGWRIDYVMASQNALSHVKEAFIHNHVKGSDHCPVGIVL
jgi:exodeoxyribonuclease-3